MMSRRLLHSILSASEVTHDINPLTEGSILPYHNIFVLLSDLFEGHNSHKVKGPLEHSAYGLAQQNTSVHVLIPDNSVLLVVLLHLYAEFVDEIGEFVDCQFSAGFVEDVHEFDEESRQVTFVLMSDLVGSGLMQFIDALSRETYINEGITGFADDRAHTHIGIEQVNSGVASRVKHLVIVKCVG